MIEFTVIPKDLFFDRARVINTVKPARRKALSKIGAFIRTRARTSMRRRDGAAPPGQPPHVHQGDLKRFLFFAFDPARESVVVGPLGFRGSRVPPTLEFGGDATVLRRKLRRGQRPQLVQDEVRIEARPYMAPALDAELRAGTIPRAWRHSISR